MSLSKLNHDCFLAVLRDIPLSKQLHFRQLSTFWCATLESQLRHRRSLALIEPSLLKYTYPLPRPSHYTFTDPLFLNSSSIHLLSPLLIRLFPSVEKLLIFGLNIEPTYFRDYLSRLSGSLSTLAFFYYFQMDWSQLEALSGLKHLYIWWAGLDKADECQLARVLPRLETFATSTGIPCSALRQFGPSLRGLYCDHLYGFTGHWDQSALLEGTIDTLKHLSIQSLNRAAAYPAQKAALLQGHCWTFPQLESLHFEDETVPLELLAKNLVNLRKLKKLSVSKKVLQKAIEEGVDVRKWEHLKKVKIVGF